MSQRWIALFRPAIREEAVAAAADVLRSGWLGLGPRTREFEQAFAAYVGAPACIATSSASAALQLALRVLDLPEGTEVVTTPLTFVGANQVLLHERLRPVFADVDPTTGNLDPAAVADALGERTGALVVLHYGGLPCDLDELYAVAHDRGVPVVEDCAHACGAEYRGRRIGSNGRLHAFSFHAVKNLPMADGGALTVVDEEVEARLRRLRWFGISSDTFERSSGQYRWDYAVSELGFKHHPNDVMTAIGLAQLAHVDADNERRAAVVARYRRALAAVPGLELTRVPDDRRSSNHLFVVLADRRDDLVERLAERGIETGVHYRPSYDFPLFAGERLPGVESFWRRAVSLPLHALLTDDEVDEVAATIAEGW